MGALVEPVAVALRASKRVLADKSELVVVVGAGPIGILVSLILQATGYERVVVLEKNSSRRNVASSVKLNAAPTLKDAGADDGNVATFIDCSGSPSAITFEIKEVRRGGRVVLVGLSTAPVEFDSSLAVLKEIEIVGSAGYSRADFTNALELLASGEIPVDSIITQVCGIDTAAEVFARLNDPNTSQIKMLLKH